ncbi:MAG: RNA-binding protein [Candidatus Omnitrophica bacterium]|nr:RNA-binding protein [Candidatus Omnitrophota bacterium]
MNIFVGNLPREATQEDLQAAFSAFGQVASVNIIKDKFTGDPRGFGFVEMPAKAEADAAIAGVKEIKGRMVTVNEARPREASGPRGGGGGRGGFGGGGSRGGFGGGGYGGGGGGGRDRGPRRSSW